MRIFGSEMSSYVSVLVVTAGVTASVPLDVLNFRTAPTEPVSPVCAFVSLGAQEEAAFLRKAKDVWRKSGGSRIYADLVFAELPEERTEEVLPVSSRPVLRELPIAVRNPPPFLPSLRADAPRQIRPEPVVDEPAFSREELLKID